jgi:hypothetical protein
MSLAHCTLKKTRHTCHINFLRNCLRCHVIPKGFTSKFHPQIGFLSLRALRRFDSIEYKFGIQRMCATTLYHSHIHSHLDHLLEDLVSQLRHLTIEFRIAFFSSVILFTIIIDYYTTFFLSHIKLNYLIFALLPLPPLLLLL